MQSMLLFRTRQLSDHLLSRQTQIAFVAMLLVLWLHFGMALSAVTMTLHDEMVPAATAGSVFVIETDPAVAHGMGCCTAAMALLCPQSCMAGQAIAAVALQLPTISPLSIFLTGPLFHAGTSRTPTPPPRA